MGGKKSAAAVAPQPTQQVQTPDVDVAQTAAMKALAAQGDVRAAQTAEAEKKQMGAGLAAAPMQPQRRPRPQKDPASVANATPGGMVSGSAVLTG